MNFIDADYLDLLRDIRDDGEDITTRNETVKRQTDCLLKFNATPLVGVRKTAWKNALREWEWFMTGSSYTNDLHPAVRHWWQPWAGKSGRVRHNYAEQFRDYGDGADGFDQIAHLIDGVKNHPFSRRNVVTTWHAAQMADSATPITNCHGTVIQAFVSADNRLSLTTYQRSADAVCGVPHNWIQYWAFLLWLARRTGRTVGSLTWFGGDVHVYRPHLPIIEEMMRADRSGLVTPNLVYTQTSDDFKADDFTLDGPYSPRVTTRAEMVV